MEPCDLLLTGGDVLVTAEPVDVVTAGGVAVVGDRVAGVGPAHALAGRWSPRERVDTRGAVVAAGAVDAHVHLGSTAAFGRRHRAAASEGPFVRGGRGPVITPLVAGALTGGDAELTEAVVAVRVAAMLRAGFTGVVDAGSSQVEAVAAAAARVGIRVATGPSLVDAWHTSSGFGRRADTDAVLAAADATLVRLARQDALVTPVLSAAGTQTSTDDLLRGIAALARAHGVGVHVHSHVTTHSVADHAVDFGATETARLLRADLLGERLTLLHAGALTDDDVAALATAGVAVNHNPVGNALFGFGATPGGVLPRLIAAGVTVSLGSDWSAAVTPPGELVRTALVVHREAAGSDLALGPAAALGSLLQGPRLVAPGGEPVGAVRVGALADLVVTRTDGAHHLGSTDPVTALTWHSRADDVDTVVVGGRVRVRNGRLVDVDELELVDVARETVRRRAAR